MDDPKMKYLTIEELQEELGETVTSARLVMSHRSVRLAASFVFFMFVTVIVSMIFLPWVQTVQGDGSVIAYSPNDRQQHLEAPVDGRIAQWLVTEGSRVKQGQIIVELTDIDPDFLLRVEQERDAAASKLKAANVSLEASRRNLERQRQLFAAGLSSRRALELAEIEEAKFLGDVASSLGEMARIETKFARQSSQRVLAPRDGVVQRVLTPQGGVVVKQGDFLALIVPDTDKRAVELYILGNDLPLVVPGQNVRVQFEGWPAIQFSGWPSVAIGTFGGVVSLVDPSDNGKGKFRVLVVPDEAEPWPTDRYLRQGVRAVGFINQGTVRLGWELWRRLNAFPLSTSEPPELSKPTKRKLPS